MGVAPTVFDDQPTEKEASMKPIRKILFPLDLGSTAPKLVPHVETMVTQFDAELHLLFVARDFSYFKSIYVPHPSISNFIKEIVAGAEKKLDEFKNAYFGKLNKIKSVVVPGDPAEKILDYAEAQNIDLIVIGTHGRKGMEKVIFGSTAERVIHKSQVPTLVVNPYKAAA